MFVSIENRPVDARSISANLSNGALALSTSGSDTSGVFGLYHDSEFSGPYLDLSTYYSNLGEIVITFRNAPMSDINVTIALRAIDGTLIYRPTIPAETTTFRLALSDYVSNESTMSELRTIYETRWFFSIPNGTAYSLESIVIIPEPQTVGYFFLAFLGFFIRNAIQANKALQPTPSRFAAGIARTLYRQFTSGLARLPAQGG